jgi:hypothetical protein
MMPRGARVPGALSDTVAEITVRTVRRLAGAMSEEEGEHKEGLTINDAVLPERKVEKSPREAAMSFALRRDRVCECETEDNSEPA